MNIKYNNIYKVAYKPWHMLGIMPIFHFILYVVERYKNFWVG